jgi:hypothetical protein
VGMVEVVFPGCPDNDRKSWFPIKSSTYPNQSAREVNFPIESEQNIGLIRPSRQA